MKPRGRSILAIATGILLCHLSGLAFTEEISTPTRAEELCRTAQPCWDQPSIDSRTSYDPLLDAMRRHDYAFARNRRLLEVFQVTLDNQGYRFLPGQADTLTIDTLEPFPLFGGSFEVDLGQTQDLTVTVGEDRAETIRAGHQAGRVFLILTFQLISLEDPSRAYCVTNDAGLMRF